MIDQLTLDDFAPLSGKALALRAGDDTHDAVVVSVRRVAGGTPGGREPFSLILRSGPPDHYWPQGTYTLVHPEHGDMHLFMVPLGPDEHGMTYEISFS